ncbi:A24 family peptidase [Streptomyces sp. CRN 30]|uniref:A24 family peptidase n=1 Tax=Streptomyces sp. CRN 30 TaxID=3075613 RepID=UPI002A804113|nr:A24 family peptidase [Streptomyces sp. CRN 30]
MSAELSIAALAALWGAVAGALLPRAAYRFSVPSGEEWRSTCPDGHPVEGWLGAARCSRGGAAYGPGAAVPATVTALACAALAAATGTRPELAVWLLLAPVAVLLTLVDVRVRRLPDVLTLPLAGAALVLLGLITLVPEHAGSWSTALYGTLALGAGYYALFLINPSGMAFGDVKLALGAGAVLGWYGWSTLVLGAFAGFLLGSLYGLVLVVARRTAGGEGPTYIAFGPFLIGGVFLGLLVGAYTA